MPPIDSHVLTPDEMHEMRKVMLGWSFKRLSAATLISTAQLCQFETKIGNLRPDQLRLCEKVLMRAVRNRGAAITKLVAGERVDGRRPQIAVGA